MSDDKIVSIDAERIKKAKEYQKKMREEQQFHISTTDEVLLELLALLHSENMSILQVALLSGGVSKEMADKETVRYTNLFQKTIDKLKR